MTNIKLKGNKEIDLLAIDQRNGKNYHIESCVSTTFHLRKFATYRKNGVPLKNGIDYFIEKKFEHRTVKEAIKNYFGDKPYERVLVVWDIADKDISYYDWGITIERMILMIYQLVNSAWARVSGSRDDILRTMELVYLERKWEEKLAKDWQKDYQAQFK